MPNLTPNLNLKKPLLNETADIDVLNENFDKIDAEIGNMPKKDGTLQAGLNAEKVGGKTVSELAPASHTHTKTDITDFTHNHTINEITNLFSNLPRTVKIEKSNKDSNGIYTQVDYKREDGTLYMRSVLSGGTSPQYTTRTITIYDTDGTTVLETITHTLTYDSDGNLISEL